MSPMTKTPAASTPTPRDFRQEVTDTIIKLMQEGTAPWLRPWDASGILTMPMNPTSGKSYRGGNAIYLLAVSFKRGYEDPRFMTYKQAAENGWQVKKGERGVQIEFWDVKRMVGERPDDDAPDEEQGPLSKRLIHRIYTVFNAEQIAGIPAHQAKKPTPFEAVAAGESILTNSGAVIRHDQINGAFYRPATDTIHLPRREYFKENSGYYGTALHELAHWTGHKDRLNRLTLIGYQASKQEYAKEELRAELASVFLAAERGIPHDTDRHAAYIGSWIKALEDDKNEIFKAAADAGKAVDYLLALERGQTPTTGKPAEIAEEPTPPAAPEPDAPMSHAARLEKAKTLALDFGPDR